MENQSYIDFEKRWEQIQEQKEIESRTKIAQLDKEAKLLPLKIELLSYIDDFIRILDLSNEWFLRSRFEKDPEKKKLAQIIWKFYDKRANLIVSELEGVLP